MAWGDQERHLSESPSEAELSGRERKSISGGRDSKCSGDSEVQPAREPASRQWEHYRVLSMKVSLSEICVP